MNIEKLLKENNRLNSELAQTSAERNTLFELIVQLYEMLVWCSGSRDFQEGGKARIGWEKGGIPTLERASKIIESLGEEKDSKIIKP